MRKTCKVFFSLFLFLVIVSLAYASCPEGTQPQLGHTFKGIATYSGSVLVSKALIATVGDNEVSTTTDSSGNYQIVAVKCGVTGSDTVSFTVCTRVTSETGNFSTGAKTEKNLTISSACPTTTTTTGGGAAGAAGAAGGAGGAVTPSETNLDDKATFTTIGYTAKQTQGDTATFTVEGVTYTAELTKLTDDSITITVAGQLTILKIGETAEFDVNGDEVSDISATLKSIEGGKAEIVYRMIEVSEKLEEVPYEEALPAAEAVVEEEAPPAEKEAPPEPKEVWGWIIVLAIVIVGLTVYFVYTGKKK